jgi:hypothetical protein
VKMKRLPSITLLVGACFLVLHSTLASGADRPRIIATTDGEIDDRCSMVRFLLYGDQWDIEAIVYSSSKFHWKGHKWAGEDWIERDIDLYATFYDNLKQDASFVVPNEPGRTLHIILEVTDDGDPPLTRYQRIVFTIAK